MKWEKHSQSKSQPRWDSNPQLPCGEATAPTASGFHTRTHSTWAKEKETTECARKEKTAWAPWRGFAGGTVRGAGQWGWRFHHWGEERNTVEEPLCRCTWWVQDKMIKWPLMTPSAESLASSLLLLLTRKRLSQQYFPPTEEKKKKTHKN